MLFLMGLAKHRIRILVGLATITPMSFWLSGVITACGHFG